MKFLCFLSLGKREKEEINNYITVNITMIINDFLFVIFAFLNCCYFQTQNRFLFHREFNE